MKEVLLYGKKCICCVLLGYGTNICRYSEIGAHVRSNIGYLIFLNICLDREQSHIGSFSPKSPIFLHTSRT